MTKILGYHFRYIARCCLLLFLFVIIVLNFVCLLGDADSKNYIYSKYSFPSKDNISSEYKIVELQKAILKLQTDLKQLVINTSEGTLKDYENSKKQMIEFHDLSEYLKKKADESEINNGKVFHNEYEITPFDRFSANRLYLVNPGMGKRVIEKPIGLKKNELGEVILFGTNILNEKYKGHQIFSISNFHDGIYRTEPGIGTHYDLYFKMKMNDGNFQFEKVSLTRSYSPLKLMQNTIISNVNEIVNIIIPLKERLKTFKYFMNQFIKVCIQQDKNVFLTVVYFGSTGMNEVRSLMYEVSSRYDFKNMKLILLNATFSRGLGLQAGVDSWKGEDVLMFFCDVDVVFTSEFLQRCRINAIKSEKVYYPMVFSLYNPNVVYNLHKLPIPNEEEQMKISKETGFWRDFGFGMTCQYKSDFKNVGGINEFVSGWGMEDVLLYRKYVKSKHVIIRVPDYGIFHFWHEKFCDPNTNWEQYSGCIRSKALNEASHSQLGVLAFKEDLEKHELFANGH